jgi:hypothetical protein
MKKGLLVAAAFAGALMLFACNEESHVFDVSMDVGVEPQGGKVFISGQTNLPKGAKLLVTLSQPETDYRAQDKAIVGDGGTFSAGPFSSHGSPLQSGTYDLDISLGLPRLQSKDVQAVIGAKGQFIAGPWVETCGIVGKDANCFSFEGTIKIRKD